MPNWTDKDTDKLFQQGSEQYDFKYNPAAWEQMRILLDRDRRRRVFIWWAAGLFSLLLLSLAVFLLWGKKSSSNLDKQVLETHQNPIGSDEKNREDILKETDNQLAMTPRTPSDSILAVNKNHKIGLGETGKQELTPPHPDGFGEEREAGIRKTPTAQGKAHQGLAKGTANGNRPTDPTALAESGKGWEGTGQPVEPIAVAGAPTQGTHVEDSLTSRPNEKAALLPGLSLLPLPLPGQRAGMPELPVLGLANSSAEGSPARPNGNTLLLGGGLGPELNSVGFGDFSRLNWKFGVQLAYRYRSKWGLGIGANYIRMRYEAGRGKFNLPSTFPFLDKLVGTSGTCKMLELPLELSYYAGQQSGLVASVGIGSYILFSETYTYDYTYYHPDHIQSWSSKENGNYWFGMATISLGYHRWVAERAALRLAPYLQLPLKGVGRGEVKLFNVGASLRMDFALIK